MKSFIQSNGLRKVKMESRVGWARLSSPLQRQGCCSTTRSDRLLYDSLSVINASLIPAREKMAKKHQGGAKREGARHVRRTAGRGQTGLDAGRPHRAPCRHDRFRCIRPASAAPPGVVNRRRGLWCRFRQGSGACHDLLFIFAVLPPRVAPCSGAAVRPAAAPATRPRPPGLTPRGRPAAVNGAALFRDPSLTCLFDRRTRP